MDSEQLVLVEGKHKGKRFGRLTALGKIKGCKTIAYLCVCDCGKKTKVNSSHLLNGNTKSCGCYRDEKIGKVNFKYGAGGTPEYVAWRAMKGRCNTKSNISYHNYGGRGITVCARWKDFNAFLEDMGKMPIPKTSCKSVSLDRVDTNKGYSPDNCRWATSWKQQCRNRRNTISGTYLGEELLLIELAEALRVDRVKLWRAHRDAGSLEGAVQQMLGHLPALLEQRA